jgi:uncharacterized protein YndB with AHSA1/START domain
MSKTNLTVDRENRQLSMWRVFDAPRELVFKACTDPKLVSQWWGPRNVTTTVDKMDVRPGGVWRYVQRDDDGNEYGFNGEYREVVSPERLSYTFEFEGMPGHVLLETLTFEDLNGKTKITTTSVFETLEDLEGMIASGMEEGANDSWERFAELLAKQS